MCPGMRPPERNWAKYAMLKSFIFLVGCEWKFADFVIDVKMQQWIISLNIGLRNSCPRFHGAASLSYASTILSLGDYRTPTASMPRSAA